jgi:diguanylate cyclase (GGDEF)-like protein
MYYISCIIYKEITMANKPITRDPLTNLPTKDDFEQIFTTALNAKGEFLPVSLAFFDIDQFKAVNDNYGHSKGDDVLNQIADHLASLFPEDVGGVCRIGGDEFAIVLKQTEKEDAFLRLEKARDGVANLDSLSDISPYPTISIGVATYPDDGTTRQEIIRKADDALFRAKLAGRNRVALAREEKKVPKTSHFTQGQLDRLTALSAREGVGEAELLREGLDDLLKKYSS